MRFLANAEKHVGTPRKEGQGVNIGVHSLHPLWAKLIWGRMMCVVLCFPPSDTEALETNDKRCLASETAENS